MSKSSQTAADFAGKAGLYGRQGGGAVMDITISRFRFGQLQRTYGVIDNATISNMAGHTQTFVPREAVPHFNRYAKFSFPK